jgi:ribosomal protein S12 methylthiotransferase
MRGQHVSKTIEQLVEEAKGLVKKGVKEVMLIAQELTYYGLDIYKERALPKLLNALADVEGLEWIRLHYAYPSKFPLEVLDTMRERDNICKYIDIPLQHASNNMLKAMRRNITREEMTELIMEIRKRVPGIAIRTTLITGFPGETLEDVEELKEFLQLHKFDRVGIFTYSHEENTSAYDLVDDVPAEEKQRRAEEIMEVQQEISLAINQAKEGQIVKVIIDKKEAGRWLGRTQFDSVEVDNEVVINTTKRLKSGDMVMVKITKAYDYDLEGELVGS